MKFPLILAAFIALCGAAEMQNSAAQSSSSAQNLSASDSIGSGLAQNLGTSDKTGSDSAQNFKSVREPAWLKDVNLTCAKYGIDTSAHPEFRAYARLKDGSALAFASPKAMFAYFFESGSSSANFSGASAGANSESKNQASGNLGEANSTDANFGGAEGSFAASSREAMRRVSFSVVLPRTSDRRAANTQPAATASPCSHTP